MYHSGKAGGEIGGDTSAAWASTSPEAVALLGRLTGLTAFAILPEQCESAAQFGRRPSVAALDQTHSRKRSSLAMAYTFTDHYRAARLCLRLNAVLIGLGLGLLLLIYPRDLFMTAGITLGSAWTARIGGASLIGLGIGQLSATAETDLPPASLLAAVISNGAISISLLIAYFDGDMVALHPFGVAGLLVIFVVCLLTAVLSAPHIRRKAGQY